MNERKKELEMERENSEKWKEILRHTQTEYLKRQNGEDQFTKGMNNWKGNDRNKYCSYIENKKFKRQYVKKKNIAVDFETEYWRRQKWEKLDAL